MEIRLLGSLQVVDDDGRVLDVPGRKVRALVTRLALDAGRLVAVDRLIEDLWGDDAPAKADNALQSLVSKARRSLGRADLVLSRGGGYLLEAPPGALDCERFDALVHDASSANATGAVAEALSLLDEALALWRGQPLVDCVYDEFAQPTIARLNEARVVAEEARLDALLALGREHEVIVALEALVVQHPLRERLRALQMLALYRAGRQADALRVYDDARAVLVDELGVEPGPALRDLQHAILQQDTTLERAVDLPDAAHAPRSAARRSNLPASLTSLIGRHHDLEMLIALVGEHRLVTVIGPGGGGKTRLATEVARCLVDHYDDGVWLIELAAVVDHDALAAVVVNALGLVDAPAPPLDRLCHYLADKQLLLVVDNCEHVIVGAATMIESLLRTCPGVRVVATSREALAVPGEVLWSTPPLAADDAVELFVERARAVAPGFTSSSANAPTIADICARLDGLPLAIELAAGRVRTLTVDEIAERLSDRFRLLSGGARTAMRRQQTLRAVVDWSYELLFDDERLLFDRLSVFAGGCAAADAVAVCTDETVVAADVDDLLARLVDKSLVFAVQTGTTTRYHLLQTLADYGREHLARSGDAEVIGDRHAAHFVALADRGRAALRGDHQEEWVTLMRAGYDNLRAAMASSLGRADKTAALSLGAGLGWYCWLNAGAAEASRWLEAALALPGDIPAALRAQSLTWAAYLARLAVHGELSDRRIGEALDTIDELDDPSTTAYLSVLLGSLLRDTGRAERAATVFTNAASACERVADDPWIDACATYMRAGIAHLAGDITTAETLLGNARDQLVGLGDLMSSAMCDWNIARLAQSRGDFDTSDAALARAARVTNRCQLRGTSAWLLAQRGVLAAGHGRPAAETLLDDAIEQSRALDHPIALALALNTRAMLHCHNQRWDAGRRDANEALVFYQRAEVPFGAARALTTLGIIAEHDGDLARATQLHENAIDTARRSGDPNAIAASIEGLARAAAARGDRQQATDLLDEAAMTRRSAGRSPTPIEQRDIARVLAAIDTLTTDVTEQHPNTLDKVEGRSSR